MGLQSTQIFGPILNGAMRNNKEGLEFVREAKQHGIKNVVEKRDIPWGDYSQAPKHQQPRKRSEPGL